MYFQFIKDEYREDYFGWGPARETLRGAILGLQPPGCIAVYGAWGAGKTTFLQHLMDKDLVEGVSVWFDPWEYERSGNVIEPLLRSIFAQLSASNETTVDWQKRAVKLIGRLGKLTLGAAYKAGTAYAGAHGVHLPHLPEEVEKLSLDDLKAWFADEKKSDEIQEAKKEFQELVLSAMKGKPERRLVVFLDDLDRCLPNTALSVIEATKLLLCGKPLKNKASERSATERPDGSLLPIVFVFALDRQLVGEAIAAHYEASTGYTGESYLEKIFDISIEIPQADPEGITKLLGALDLLKRIVPQEKDANFLKETLNKPTFSNPRVLMRTINRLQLLANGLKGKGWPTTDEDWRRLIWWLAGAERYRAFRLAFLSATPAEIRLLHFHLNPPDDKAVAPLTSYALKQIAAMPRFGEFYSLMFPGYLADQVELQRYPRLDGSDQMTILEIDTRLRQLGI
jgi:hypothetical protein